MSRAFRLYLYLEPSPCLQDLIKKKVLIEKKYVINISFYNFFVNMHFLLI